MTKTEYKILVNDLRRFIVANTDYSEERENLLKRLWESVKDDIRPCKQYIPLTNNQILDLNEKYGYFEFGDAQGSVTKKFVRAIEKAHGIEDGEV